MRMAAPIPMAIPLRKNPTAVPRRDGGPVVSDGRQVWRELATHYALFRGTPSMLWLDHTLQELFGVTERLSAKNADGAHNTIKGLPSQALLPFRRQKIALVEDWWIEPDI